MKMYCCNYEAVKKAHTNIRDFVHCTPLVTSQYIDDLSGFKVFLKAENLQKSGSFKIRGAFNAAKNYQGSNCLVTHSSGNFGQALALAGKELNLPVFVVTPKTSPPCKKNATLYYGANVIECDPSHEARILNYERIIKNEQGTGISSCDDPYVIAGQGTIGIEILEQNSNVDAIVVPVAGGGMISGIALAAKVMKPSIKIYGAEPEVANSCYLSLKKEVRTTLIDYPNTIADGLCTNIGNSTWPIICNYVDDIILVSEQEIKNATKIMFERTKMVVEPSGATAVAAVLSKRFELAKGMSKSVQNIAVVLSGGNIGIQTLKSCFVSIDT